ncbi:MAG: flagellar biosynthesis anti-sigma factor FlgM [Acidobacteriota bacterium]
MCADPKTRGISGTRQREHASTTPCEPATSPSHTSGPYRVVVPAVAREIEEIRKLLDAIPDVRSDKVRAIRKSLDADRYGLRPDEVADRMIRGAILRRSE